MQKRKRNKGFTLIELIVVIAILGILGAIVAPRLFNMQNNARIDADKTSAQTIIKAAQVYLADKNLTTDAEVIAVDIDDLETAKLIDTDMKTQVNKTLFTLTISGTADAPVFTVKDSQTTPQVVLSSDATVASGTDYTKP